ncbi:hypothetical protein BCR44DRAFT_1443365 [Catenaria anguillulae PL171]|uniref:Mitochondrial zinc maintenance protein 1, mitochondrial n=1 Tax=Catenaria anguillulae PL171 TaxID=765915 RepID=A0A1Y2H6I6_9FUNG|nr:hypothetical protein BCR44DRAFT_43210 [Catenaria anguillulae PL171]ORZ31043.1 hypothetical protein BCR44DRAFT_1443365 [Catenaria anguillulae PL171]
MSSPLRLQALAAYKRLLRVQQNTFAGDMRTLLAARDETRKQFREASTVTDESQVNELLQKANDIATYLERNIVQAVQKAPDTYELQYDPNRHELNDNKEVKKPYVKGKRIPCCGAGSEALPKIGVNY